MQLAITRGIVQGYKELHHIVPRSLGGNNSKNNLVQLTAREHFIAHLLLAKATDDPKMIKALHKMVYSANSVQLRDYKINSKVFEFLRVRHAKIVSNYSKNTVVAKQMYTNEIKRISTELFDKYNGILYEAIAKGRIDSEETKLKKKLASKKPRKYTKGLKSRSIAASKYSYITPLGFCETSAELVKLYPTFTKNTLLLLNNDTIITKKFCYFHKEFYPHIGKTFQQYGIIKQKRS
jgi:hypothetical protein